jgi:hypothetical protein
MGEMGNAYREKVGKSEWIKTTKKTLAYITGQA